MSVSINTPSGRTMASAATVVSSATASQKSSASANPTALDRASARYRAAQSRYRQAKAALKAIKRQIVPVDAFGNRKPRLRGWLHLATLPLCIAASIVLICIAPAGSVKAACAVYGASAMLLFGNSALLHVVPWHSENDHYKFYEQRGYRLTDEVYEGGRHGWLVKDLSRNV